MKKAQKKFINLSVRFQLTNEIFKLEKIQLSSLVKDVRAESEITTGIPAFIQQLYYLDKCDLVDSTTLQSNDVVSGAVITLDVWHKWQDLIMTVIKGNATETFSKGVTLDSEFNTPSSSVLSKNERLQWLQERANMALFIAAHRGHIDLCQQLIKSGANINWQTKLGRSALHLAAARDQSSVIDLLLQHGADINQMDSDGMTAMKLASKYGHKGCERHLFMFQWKERARTAGKPKYLNPSPMSFQVYNTFLPQWKIGPAGQFYVEKKMPPGEFIGSALDAPKRNWHRRCSTPAMTEEEESQLKLKLEKSVSFESWMKQKNKEKKITEEQQKVKEENQKLFEEEKRRARIARVQAMLSGGEVLRDVSSNSGFDNNEFYKDEMGNARVGGSVSDTKTRVRQLLVKFGLIDTTATNDHRENNNEEDMSEQQRTVYDEWLQQRRNMGKPMINDDMSLLGGYLPYQQMIREFCTKKCSDA